MLLLEPRTPSAVIADLPATPDTSDTADVGGSSDEAGLMARARAGDCHAIEAIYTMHRPSLLCTARGLTRSATAAEDLVHDAFIGFIEAVRNGRGPTESVGGYLATAVRRRHIRQAMHAQRCRPQDPADFTTLRSSASDSLDDELDPVVLDSTFRTAFATLPQRWREVLWQCEVEGRKPKEIGARLGITANAAAALAYRARRALSVAYATTSAVSP